MSLVTFAPTEAMQVTLRPRIYKVDIGKVGFQGPPGTPGTAAATASTFEGLGTPTAGEIRRVTNSVQGLYHANGVTWVGPTLLDAREFGVIGATGSVNKATIDAALARATSLGGADVVIPVAGIVPVSAAPVVPSNTHLFGVGHEATRLQIAADAQYAVAFGGSNSRISNLWIDAASTQTSGGGVSFIAAGNRRMLDHIRFGDNLFRCIDARSTGAGGHWTIDHINLDFVSGIGTFLDLGDGTNLVTDIILSHIIGGAANYAGVGRWFWIHNNVDTVKMSDAMFVGSTTASVLGEVGSGAVTEMQMTDVTLDGCTAGLLIVRKVRGLEHRGLQLNTSLGAVGLDYETGAKDVLVLGGKTQNCYGTAERIQSGSKVRMIGRRVTDNNTSNGAFGFGIEAAIGATDFELIDIRTGNGDLSVAGFQKYGIWVNASCDRFRVQNHTGNGNVSGAFFDNSGTPATWKELANNR